MLKYLHLMRTPTQLWFICCQREAAKASHCQPTQLLETSFQKSLESSVDGKWLADDFINILKALLTGNGWLMISSTF